MLPRALSLIDRLNQCIYTMQGAGSCITDFIPCAASILSANFTSTSFKCNKFQDNWYISLTQQ